jgi:hypothetical protein
MAEDLTTKILDVRPIAVLDAKAGMTSGFAVDFNVGKHGPFVFTCKQADYTAAAVKAGVEALAAEIRKTLS